MESLPSKSLGLLLAAGGGLILGGCVSASSTVHQLDGQIATSRTELALEQGHTRRLQNERADLEASLNRLQRTREKLQAQSVAGSNTEKIAQVDQEIRVMQARLKKMVAQY